MRFERMISQRILFGPGKTNEEGGYEIISNRELNTYLIYSTPIYIVVSGRILKSQ